MREVLLFEALPLLSLLSLLAGPPVRAALRRDLGLTTEAGGSRVSWAWRWGLALLVACHVVGFALPRAVAWLNRGSAGPRLGEEIGLACTGLALGGLLALAREAARAWRALREQDELERQGVFVPSPAPFPPSIPVPPAPSALDTLLFLSLLLALGSGLVITLRYSWGSSWYADTLLPYVQSLLRLRPDLQVMSELPFAVRLHTVSGFLVAALFPWSRSGLVLARPWLRLRRRALASRRAVRAVPARRLGLRARLALAALLLLLGALGLGTGRVLYRIGSSQGYAPAQPIAFSHRLHAGTKQIPCLYCHFAAERSRHAGIPALNVCMNCHRQIRKASAELEKLKEAVAQERPVRWVQVHLLPDFTYFNHSQHVAVAGLACQRCHGPVETMERVEQRAPLTMGWCIGCHRDEGVVQEARALNALVAAFGGNTPRGGRPAHRGVGGQDCSKCHY